MSKKTTLADLRKESERLGIEARKRRTEAWMFELIGAKLTKDKKK